MRKIIKHHIEGGTRESHPRVQDLLHPRLGKPRRGLQILDTRMGFPRPSLNVVLDSINLSIWTWNWIMWSDIANTICKNIKYTVKAMPFKRVPPTLPSNPWGNFHFWFPVNTEMIQQGTKTFHHRSSRDWVLVLTINKSTFCDSLTSQVSPSLIFTKIIYSHFVILCKLSLISAHDQEDMPLLLIVAFIYLLSHTVKGKKTTSKIFPLHAVYQL